MSRLIDADELLSYIDRVKNSGLGKQKTIEYITKYISNMPTAYDIDKVVSELEDRSELIHIKHYCYDEVEDCIRLIDAIQIVREGAE